MISLGHLAVCTEFPESWLLHWVLIYCFVWILREPALRKTRLWVYKDDRSTNTVLKKLTWRGETRFSKNAGQHAKEKHEEGTIVRDGCRPTGILHCWGYRE